MFLPSNIAAPHLAALIVPRDAIAAVPPPPPPPALLSPVGLPGHHRPTVGVNVPPPEEATPTPSLSTSAGVVVTITPTPTAIPASMDPPPPSVGGMEGPHDEPTECRLLGPFAILVQLALGGLALLSLVYKRWRERPQRPMKIWFFDVSKQVVGSALVHVANVFMSMLTSGRFSIKVDPTTVGQGATAEAVARAVAVLMGRDEPYVPNPCSFYLLNLAIDTTVGIPVLIFLLRLTTKIVALTSFGKPAESIQSGNYGSPPKAWWWLKQSVIYFCGLMGMKIFVLLLFMMLPWISRVGDWALGWTEGNEKLQIVFVMMLFPLIMNALQYYIIDSFIKAKDEDPHAGHGFGGEAHHGEAGVYEELSVTDGSEEEDSDIEDGGKMANGAARLSGQNSRDRAYDPAPGDDSPTEFGSSSGGKGAKGQTLPKELYSPE